MSRYIDTKLVPALFDEEYKKTRELIYRGETHLDNLAEGFSEATRVIRTMPTADVVEVVRCKDCKYYEIHKPTITLNCEREGKLVPMMPNDYCSYGERREE